MPNSKETQNNTEKTEPLVFVNQPITSSGDDIIGFSTQVDTICEAIKDGSSMIGLIADYGSGKSSLTELLCEKVKQSPYKYPAPIIINMWDSINEKKVDSLGNEVVTQHEVSRLTKSFLYQLSKGKGRLGFSSYINRRLSKNHGNFSFSVGSVRFWGFFLFAALMYGIYLIGENVNSNLLATFEEGSTPLFNFLQADIWVLFAQLHPAFLIFATLLLIVGIANTCVVFSHWKNQDARETEMNDVFDLYTQIITHIKPRRGKKQIIVVEDLDRIGDKSVIIGFMKELYRFQNSAQNNSKKFAFVVAVKPEDSLTEINSHRGNDEKASDFQIYPKLFDITIPLKPIHYDDYRAVLLQLIKRDPKRKERLEKIVQKKIDGDILPDEFKWLVTGENLSVRDLKDRLNHAIMIMTSRKEYNTTTAVTFKGCAAVTYLESRYPRDYLKLIQNEQGFAALMSESVGILNQNLNEEKAIEALKISFSSSLGNEHVYNGDFVQDLCQMIWDETLNYDFRMYFYTYPSGSHVKTTEERKLCDMLLMPAKNRDFNELDAIVETVYQNGENNIATSTLQTLEHYSKVVLMNQTLLNVAGKCNWKKLADIASSCFVNTSEANDIAIAFWKRVYNTEFPQKEQFLLEIVKKVYSLPSSEQVLNIRKQIVEVYRGNIVFLPEYAELFYNAGGFNIPIISSEEIELIDNAETSISLIDINLLTANEFNYIANLICCKELEGSTIEDAKEILSRYLSLAQEGIEDTALNFLQKNHLSDNELFHACCLKCESDGLITYLNSLDIEQVTNDYYVDIDEYLHNVGLSMNILHGLAARALYKYILINAASKEDYEILNQVLSDTDEIRTSCLWLYKFDENAFLKIRYYLCVELDDERYLSLYSTDFPHITIKEYTLFKNATTAIQCINVEQIGLDNYTDFIDMINGREYTAKDGLHLIRHLFDSYPCYSNFIEELNYDNFHIRDLDAAGREEVYKLLTDNFAPLDLSPIQLMIKLNCFVESVEEKISQENEKQYYKLIAELDELTPFGVKYLSSNYLTIGLSQKLADTLRKSGDNENYIIATALSTNSMVLDEDIPISSYLKVYTNVDEMYSIMSRHWDFLKAIQQSECFDDLAKTKSHSKLRYIKPIYKVPQKSEFFEWMMSNVFSDEEKKEYLDTIKEFASDIDSFRIQQIICKDDNMELLDNKERYGHIWHLFWKPEQKSPYTRAWNKRWGDELGRAS